MKRTNKERAIRQVTTYLRSRMMPPSGGTFALGWNGAIADLAMELEAGAHELHAQKLAQATKAGGEIGRCAEAGCIHPLGHVALGQKLHSDGRRTWSDRKPRR